MSAILGVGGGGLLWSAAGILWLLFAAWVSRRLKGKRIFNIPNYPSIGHPNWRQSNRMTRKMQVLVFIAGLLIMLLMIYRYRDLL